MMRFDIESGAEVAPPPNWVSKMKEKLQKFREHRSMESQRWRQQSIYRVPTSMKQNRDRVYEPQMVSIGPYHHGAEQLKSMEEHKQRALLAFLDRSANPLDCYVEALARVVEGLIGAYNQLDPKWTDNTEGFLELMIVDGCFILELMRSATVEPEALERMGYAPNDPVFSEHGELCLVPCLRSDMLMLENQIPLQVLLTLLETENHIICHGLAKQEHLSMLILNFFYGPDVPEDIEEYGKCLHILELYRRRMLRCLPCQRPRERRPALKEVDRSATELRHAGIRFKKSDTWCLNDVSFKGRVLRMPKIVVDDALESQYLNMVAFEVFNPGAGTEVSSFVYLMDSIIHSARDVKLLRDRGIIQKLLSIDQANSDEGVAELFNSMARDICLDGYGGVAAEMEKVAKYYARWLPSFTVKSKRKYEHVTSYVSLSILWGISFLVLTGIPAVYTILDYYHSK